MPINQNQIKNLRFEFVVDAENQGRPREICFVEETKTWYVFNDLPEGYTEADGIHVLDTKVEDKYWVAFAGEVIKEPSINWVVQESNTTVEPNIGYGCTSGITLTLQENPEIGDSFGVKDVAYNSSNDPIIINPNGRDIENQSNNFEIDIDGAGIIFVYFGNSIGWLQVSEAGYSAAAGGSEFEPTVLDETDVVEVGTGSDHELTITKAHGNLITVDVPVGENDDFEVDIQTTDWDTNKVGTFRLDVVLHEGQSISFDENIEGLGDIELLEGVTSSLLFDKPYGVDTWYVRQAI